MKSLKTSFIQILSISILFLASCTGNTDYLMKDATGTTGEVVVVTDPKSLRNTHIIDTVKDHFERLMHGLPQPEKFFKVFKIDTENFGSIFKYHRNVLIITFDPNTPREGTIVKQDSWARGQIVVEVLTKDLNSFYRYFNTNKYNIEAFFWNKEMERMALEFNKIKSPVVMDDIKESCGLSVTVPEGFYTVKSVPGFVYARHTAYKSLGKDMNGQIDRGILVATIPFKSNSIFTVSGAMHVLDSLTKKYVAGAKDSSYMTSERRIPFDSTALNINKEYALMVRSLWRMKGEFKGGPSLTLVTYNRKKNQIIFLNGFVYAPSFNKRNYVFQMEGILRSVKPID